MKLGVFLPSLGHNQLAIDAIASINTIISNNEDVYPSFFYKEVRPSVIRPRTMCCSVDKIYHYNGHLITTNLDTTNIALQCTMLKSINFYIADLEWTRGIGNYIANVMIYKNKKINLFVPSKEYYNALENYCNINATILDGFNINGIIKTIRDRT